MAVALVCGGCYGPRDPHREVASELRIDSNCSAAEARTIRLAAEAWGEADPGLALPLVEPTEDSPANVLCQTNGATPEADGGPSWAIAWTKQSPQGPTVYLYLGRASSADTWNVIMHELGHALGAGHVDSPGAVMYPTADHQGYDVTDADVQAVWDGR